MSSIFDEARERVKSNPRTDTSLREKISSAKERAAKIYGQTTETPSASVVSEPEEKKNNITLYADQLQKNREEARDKAWRTAQMQKNHDAKRDETRSTNTLETSSGDAEVDAYVKGITENASKATADTEERAKTARTSTKYAAETGAASAVKFTQDIWNYVNYLGTKMHNNSVERENEVQPFAAETGDAELDAYMKQITGDTKAATGNIDSTAREFKKAADYGDKMVSDVQTRYEGKVNDAAKKVGEISSTIGYMVPSIIANFIIPGSSLYVMAAGAAGNATTEALEGGASEERALLYGTAVGAVEALSEKMLDGMAGVFGKGAADDFVQGIVRKSVSNTTAQNAIIKLAGALGEGFEEFATEFADKVLNDLLLGTDERTWKDVSGDALYALVMGMLVSGVMQTGADVITNVNPARAAEIVAQNAQKSMDAATSVFSTKADQYYQTAAENGLFSTQAQKAAEKAQSAALRMKKTEAEAAKASDRVMTFEEKLERALQDAAKTVEEPQETQTQETEQTVEALPTPQEYATRNTVNAIIKDRAAMEAMGINPNGKTNSQLRAEVKAKLDAQNGTQQAAPVTETVTQTETTAEVPTAQTVVTQQTTQEPVTQKTPQEQMAEIEAEQAQITEKLKNATGAEAEALRARFTENQKTWSTLQRESLQLPQVNTTKEEATNARSSRGQAGEPAVDGGLRGGELEGNTGATGNGRGSAPQGVDQIRAETAGEGTVSVRDVTGDLRQPDKKSFKLLGPEVIAKHPEIQAAVDKAAAAGYTLHPIVGMGVAKSNVTGKFIYARGFVQGKNIWAQVDAEGVTLEQILDHETFHIQAQENPAMLQLAKENFLRTHTQAELDALIDEYVEAYFNGQKGDAQSVNDIMEELFADIYAGIQIRNGGTELGQYRASVFGGETQQTEQENKTRGPPDKSTDYGTAENHIDNRDYKSVGDRAVKAFQFDYPELHQYFVDAAKAMQQMLAGTEKATRWVNDTYETGEGANTGYMTFGGTKRSTTPEIAALLDNAKLSYADISKALDAIIQNHGQENYAAAKRVELALDDMLTNGFDVEGEHIGPNEAYIEAKSELPGGTETTEASANEDELPLFSATGEEVKTSIESFAEATGLEATRGADGKIHFYYNNEEITNVTPEHVKDNSGLGALITSSVTRKFINENEATKQYQAAANLMNEIIKTNDPEQVWAFTGAAMFSALKSNSDGQYGTTVDFTTVCRKTQEMITAMSRSMMKLHRGLTKKEVTRLQKKIIQSGGTVPCPVCYVFSRWAGIGNVLDHMKSLQEQYAKYTTEQLIARQQTLAAEIEEKVYTGEVDAKGKKIKLKDAKGNNMSDSKAIAKLLQEKENAYFKLAAEQEKIESSKKRTEEQTKRLQEIEDEMETLQLEREMLGEYVWIRDVRAQEDYKPVPDNVLFNLDAGATFATEFPAAWKYRTTRGPSAGKAIVPYADMRIGDIIQGVDKTRSTGDKTFTDMTGELTEDQAKAITNAIARAKAQNLIGGQRFQSTSDFRYDYALDYIQAFWEAQAIGSNMQTYTKIIEFAEMVAAVGGDANLSLMPKNKGYENGHLIFSAVTGIDFEAAKEARARYDSVQSILVGINDEHIRLALEDSEETLGIYVDFVIPYHASGASVEFIQELVSNLGEEYVKSNYQDYSNVQTDTKAENATKQQTDRQALRTKLLTSKKALTDAEMKLLRGNSKDITGESFETLRDIEKRALSGDKAAMKEYLSWSAGVLNSIYQKMWTEDGSEYDVRLSSKQGATIMPHEYWNRNTTRSNAYVNGFIFRSYCTSLGLNPRFTGNTSTGKVSFGDFSDSRGYWKTLIDRPMYANDGTYRDQQKVNVTDFNIDMLHSEYGQENWGKYKVAEPDAERAGRAANAFVFDALVEETNENRANRLKRSTMAIVKAKDSTNLPSVETTRNMTEAEARKILLPITQTIGNKTIYENGGLEISFEYSGNDARRSIHHQILDETGRDMTDFALVQNNLEEISQNAYPIEIHEDEKGKEHTTTVATLESVLETEEGYIPVKLTVMFYDNREPSLHVVINQEKIKKSAPVIAAWTQNAHSVAGEAPSEINVADFLNIVKDDPEFTKRVPMELLESDIKTTPVFKTGVTAQSDGTGTGEVSETNVAKGNRTVKNDLKASAVGEEVDAETAAELRKQEQLDIIRKNNPAEDEYHAWIRSTEDIKTLREAMDAEPGDAAGDWTEQDMQEAIDTGTVTVFSSKPIAAGVFVTPSRTEARSYAGIGQIYSEDVRTDDVAWLDTIQGQYAPVTEKAAGKEAAPVFYSQMAKTIDEIKQPKLGAASVVSYLRGRGVKAEEIKWSGIEEWLQGKKSVTKEELQQFAAGSMLQIDENTIDYGENRNELNSFARRCAEILAKGDPEEYYNDTFSDLNNWSFSDIRAETEQELEGRLGGIKEMFRKHLKNKYPSIDDWKIERDGRFGYVAKSDSSKKIEVASRKSLHNEFFSDEENEFLRDIEGYENGESRDLPRWGEYKLDGGDNYREIVFKMPNSTYTNDAMQKHWGDDAEGVLAHARIQDMPTKDGGKMLFIEEIQSDWHNAGKKEGYKNQKEADDLKEKAQRAAREVKETREKLLSEVVPQLKRAGFDTPEDAAKSILSPSFGNMDFERKVINIYVTNGQITKETGDKILSYYDRYVDAENLRRSYWNRRSGEVPDAPFRDNYTEFVIKRLLRMAAEEGYDSIGWTTAQQQSDRWSDEFAEGYRIEYDQDIPKFLNKYGKRWGGTVGKTMLGASDISKSGRVWNLSDENGDVVDSIIQDADNYPSTESEAKDEFQKRGKGAQTVWKFNIPDAMKESVLYEGQTMFSAAGEEVDAETLAELETMEKQENVGTSRNEYQASPALEKLGVKIDTPMVNTVGAESYVGYQKGKRISQKEWTKACKRLNATDQEIALAKDLGSGKLVEGDWKLASGKVFDVNWIKVRELADYYTPVAAYEGDKLAQIKRRNNRREEYEAMRLTAGSDNYKAIGMLRLNGNTMKRNMILTAGREAGTKLNERYFDPITRNSAERIRFVNRMLERVREFDLTKAESQMVQRMIEGTAAAAEVAKMPADSQERIRGAAESTDFDEGVKEWNLTKEEKDAAKKFKAYQDAIADMEGMDADKINRAVEAYKSAYNDFYDAINEMLVSHGYDTIGFIKGYAPHMQTDNVNGALATALQMFGLDAPVSNLPTEIAGRTEQFKPGKQWNPYFQHRNGDKTDYDAVAGYESYVSYLSNVLYHIDDIQKLRILSNSLRQKYSSEEIRNRIEYAQGLSGAPTSVKTDLLRQEGLLKPGETVTAETVDEMMDSYVESLFDRIQETTKLGNLVSVLDDYTNKLAGKQTKLDRSVESFVGRRSINFGNALSRIFGESSVVGNLSSALNQISQIPMVQAELGNKWVFRALKDVISGEVKKADFTNESDFLTGKAGTDSLLGERSWSDSDRKQKHAKVTNVMSIPFEAVDTVASQIIVRAKYLEQVSAGKSHEDALRAADDFAEKVVGNRIQGGKAMAFESKNIAMKLFSTFQLEVANAWSHIRVDLSEDIKAIEKEQGKKAAQKYTAGLLTKYSVEAFLLNRFAEAVYGGTPAMFDLIGYILGGVAGGTGQTVNGMLLELLKKAVGAGDDDEDKKEWDTGAALDEFGSLAIGDMPYVRNAASMLGYGDMNLPVPQLPTKTAKSLWDMITGDGTLKAVGNNALKEVATWLPGGNQIKKTVQGLQVVGNQGKYTDKGELVYPFDTSGFGGKVKAAKAILFGTGALDANDAYYAADNRKLSAKQTEMFKSLTGEDPDEVYDLIIDLRHVEDIEDNNAENKEKRDMIRNADLSDESKLAVYATTFDIEDKKQAMFEKFADAGLDFDDMMDIMDEYYDIYYTDLKATQKATQFARWADEHYDEETAELVKEEIKFWTNIPAEASSYEKMHSAGLDTETSEAVSDAFAALEPEDGKENVSNYQRYHAILDTEMDDSEKMTALSAVMEEETYKKVKTAKAHNVPLDAIIDGLEINAKAEGVKGADGETIDGSKALNVMKGIDGLKITDTQKNELFHAIGYKAETMWESDYKKSDYEAYFYLSDAEKEKYNEYCSWWTATKFSEFKDKADSFTADKKADGTTISGSKKQKVIDYIDSLSLTNDQKTALYAAAGYKESTVDDCPWWHKYDLRTGDYPW